MTESKKVPEGTITMKDHQEVIERYAYKVKELEQKLAESEKKEDTARHNELTLWRFIGPAMMEKMQTLTE